jgi:hypothetical protein
LLSIEIAEMKVMHLFQVAGVFSCEFPIAEVAPFLHAPVTKHRTSENGTTSTKEISTAKYSNATLSKKHDLHFWYLLHLRYEVYFSLVSMCEILNQRYTLNILVIINFS